jgi:hypothetical protein
LIEILVVMAIIAIPLLFPSSAFFRQPAGKRIARLNNLTQFAASWHARRQRRQIVDNLP